MKTAILFWTNWLLTALWKQSVASNLSGPTSVPPGIKLKLNPHSVQLTKLWPDVSVLAGELNFEVVDTVYDSLTQRIILELKGGGTLIVLGDVADLYDANGQELGNVIFSTEKSIVERNLFGKKKQSDVKMIERHPVEVVEIAAPPPAIEGIYKAYPSEMYCRYGCGNVMGVTFPYFYRPFFGYGYPLLGTEPNFPVGYGGNPITALGVGGALGPPVPPGAVGLPPGAGIPPF